MNRFTFDETAARAYIARCLRRYGSNVLGDGYLESLTNPGPEDVELRPGWNPRELIYGETWQADLLVAEAWTAGVITGPTEIQLVGAADSDGGMYTWRIAGPGGRFAICLPYWEEVRRLGSGERGATGALDLLAEATAAGNQLLAAFEDAAAGPSEAEAGANPCDVPEAANH